MPHQTTQDESQYRSKRTCRLGSLRSVPSQRTSYAQTRSEPLRIRARLTPGRGLGVRQGIQTRRPSCSAVQELDRFLHKSQARLVPRAHLRGAGRRCALMDGALALIKNYRTDGSCGALSRLCRHCCSLVSRKGYIICAQDARQSTHPQQILSVRQKYQHNDQDSQRRCSGYRRCFWCEFFPTSYRASKSAFWLISDRRSYCPLFHLVRCSPHHRCRRAGGEARYLQGGADGQQPRA